MNRSIDFKKKLFNFVFLLFSFFIFFYLTYFLFFSENGIINHLSLKKEYNQIKLDHRKILQTNNDLSSKIEKLKIGTLDLDYLDELNIDKNGILDKNDIVIVIPEN